MILDADLVEIVHNFILENEPGLDGKTNRGALEGALGRIENRILYDGLEDVFEIAGMYAVAIARGHAFPDANKRTALVSALTYLLVEGYEVVRTPALEDIMVDVAEGRIDYPTLANIFSTLAVSKDDTQAPAG
ncbi:MULTISPECIES: type II toxin-antitoxin system death-on-curing family toxin [Burkholderia cepacia complex]|uniref:type II toxin-antitoxin system death-on-curing family toxin n=1 Tax=Burkholderia cepacia complex TaxID=87882 RepID=UPI001ABAFB93|nr:MULTISPECIES: type II toxin-antitoxin system death-on-curing family toxin [Burkholderia cepacia complex]MDN7878205.1 type II toxin-antitoxin system death-on-curing family toxin [Burkholderia aenigmatica]